MFSFKFAIQEKKVFPEKSPTFFVFHNGGNLEFYKKCSNRVLN